MSQPRVRGSLRGEAVVLPCIRLAERETWIMLLDEPWMIRAIPRALVLAGAAVAGCSPIDPGPTEAGELGNGRFRYVCAGTTDPYCGDQLEADTFPPAIAVGARFSLRYELNIPGENAVVEPASRATASKEAEVITLLQAGYVAMLAQTTFGDVVDILHVSGRDVSELEVFSGGGDVPVSQVELAVGDTVELQANPKDDLGSLLAGSLLYDWRGADPDGVFRFASANDDRQVTIVGDHAGHGVLTLEAGALTVMVPVVVDASGTGTGTGNGSGSEGSTSAGESSGSDTGTGTGTSGSGSGAGTGTGTGTGTGGT